ncbi:MAG: ATP-binding protein, partial [Proteobacteria bacterium]|nr:ATP-binding protein [Pseudomonadota bacterium]
LVDADRPGDLVPARAVIREAVGLGESLATGLLTLAGYPGSMPRKRTPAEAERLLGLWLPRHHPELGIRTGVDTDELRALANLMANARQAAGSEGYVRLSVEEGPSTRTWTLSNAVVGREAAGTGLGMVLVRAWSESVGGRVDWSLDVREGRVTLTVPVDPSPGEDAP